MTDVRWKQRFANFRRALDRLGQAVELQNRLFLIYGGIR